GVGDGSNFSVTAKSLLMSLDQWNHLAFAYNDADDKMFIHFDGFEKETAVALSLPAQPGVDLSIGADSEGVNNFFNGLIDEVKIFSKALSASEIRAIYSGTSGELPTAYYAFNNNADDSSGNGHHSAVYGATFVDDRAGSPNAALSFDGNDYVLVNDHADFQITGAFTLMAWINESVPVQHAKIISRRSENYFYFLGVDNGRPYGGVGDGTSFTVTIKSIAMVASQWHLVGFVHNPSTGKIAIYYDGVLDEAAVTISLPSMTKVDVTIGGDSEGSSNFFEGLIDEVGIFDTELSADEIRQTYK
ncbi:LamG-like jellyroll fold domain-containing protein, partial [Thermodesulfobacteriota bacterium]